VYRLFLVAPQKIEQTLLFNALFCDIIKIRNHKQLKIIKKIPKQQQRIDQTATIKFKFTLFKTADLF
jgi:hypothetical protein